MLREEPDSQEAAPEVAWPSCRVAVGPLTRLLAPMARETEASRRSREVWAVRSSVPPERVVLRRILEVAVEEPTRTEPPSMRRMPEVRVVMVMRSVLVGPPKRTMGLSKVTNSVPSPEAVVKEISSVEVPLCV